MTFFKFEGFQLKAVAGRKRKANETPKTFLTPTVEQAVIMGKAREGSKICASVVGRVFKILNIRNKNGSIHPVDFISSRGFYLQPSCHVLVLALIPATTHEPHTYKGNVLFRVARGNS
jgi:hypothetical protein